MFSGAIDGTLATKGNPVHSTMASFRTIEQGFSLARAGVYGSNVAVDYQGRLLGTSGYYTANDRTVVAQLPSKGTRTIYSYIGDVFPRACLALLAALTAYAVILGARHRKAGQSSNLRVAAAKEQS